MWQQSHYYTCLSSFVKMIVKDNTKLWQKMAKIMSYFWKNAKITEESLQKTLRKHSNKWQLTVLTHEFKVPMFISSIYHYHNLNGEIVIC